MICTYPQAVQDVPLPCDHTSTPILLACWKCQSRSAWKSPTLALRASSLFEKRVASLAEPTFDHLHLLLCHIVFRV
jgi:hypothetical protein